MTTPAADQFQLNPSLDLDGLAERFAVTGRIQIADFLTEGCATALRDELAASTRWRRIINAGTKVYEIPVDQYDAMDAGQRSAIESAVIADAARRFQYRYEMIRVPDDPALAGDLPLTLGGFAGFMNSAETLGALRRITHDEQVVFADAQATRYRARDFLTRHDDDVAGKSRRFAYVLSLSEDWQPEWGGLLLFTASEDRPIEAMAPRFNALSLFTVPQAHSVSYVAPYAGMERLSVTGWLRGELPSG